MVRDSFEIAFAPGYEFDDRLGDTVVDGYRAMTYTSYDRTIAGSEDYGASGR